MTEEYKGLSDYLTISNEYAFVKVRKVATKKGVRLEIYSPKMGTVAFLDPIELEQISRVDQKFFDKLLGIETDSTQNETDSEQ